MAQPDTSKTAGMLPYGRQTIEADDVAAVAEALQGEYLTTGPAVQRFEAAFCHATGARYASSCNSGTAALHLAMMSLEIGPGDAVVVPSLTFLASANCVRFCGAEVIFADVDESSGLLGPRQLEDALDRARRQGANVRSVVVVHLNGQCADLAAIRAMTRQSGITIVEDACHALGASHYIKDQRIRVGACPLSDLACFSLHPVKAMTTGEGGVVTTNDPRLAERVARLRSHGMSRDPALISNRDLAMDAEGRSNPWYYEMAELGYNYRLPDILCALGERQLTKLDRFIEKRRTLAAEYDRLLAGLAPLVRRVPSVPHSSHAYHLYPVLIDFVKLGMTRALVMSQLRDEAIGTQVHYLPVHHQTYYQRRYGALELVGADAYYTRCLSLPIFPSMEIADVGRVVGALARLSPGHDRRTRSFGI